MKRSQLTGAVCLPAAITFAAAAQADGQGVGGAPLADPLALDGLLQLTLSLAAVVAAIFLAGWALKRLQRYSAAGPGALRVVGNLSLGARERIVLVQVGEKQILVGLTPGRINALHVLERPVPEAVEGPAGNDGRRGFQALLGGGRAAG